MASSCSMKLWRAASPWSYGESCSMKLWRAAAPWSYGEQLLHEAMARAAPWSYGEQLLHEAMASSCSMKLWWAAAPWSYGEHSILTILQDGFDGLTIYQSILNSMRNLFNTILCNFIALVNNFSIRNRTSTRNGISKNFPHMISYSGFRDWERA